MEAISSVKEFKDTITLSMIAAYLKFLVEQKLWWQYRQEERYDPETDPYSWVKS